MLLTCENIFCIYWADNACTLDTVLLNIQGNCEQCIYVSVVEAQLKKLRKEILLHFKKQEQMIGGQQMTSKQVVKDCIEFGNPAWLPVLYFNKDKEKSDILILDYNPPRAFAPTQEGENEWGVVWETAGDGTMGQPKKCPLADDWSKLDSYTFPDPDAPGRFDGIAETIAQNCTKFIIGGFHLSGFAILSSLRGFEASMMDLYLEPELFETLLDGIAAFEVGVIRNFCKCGVDAIAFYDDWGSQSSLMINPEKWREVFKPVYQKQFAVVHELGAKVYFHCCGDIHDIIDDLIEIGVDVLNLNQPDLLGLDILSQKYRGKVCFNCPVDHQTVAITGNDTEIKQYVADLCAKLATPSGGYFGYIEEYSSVGMSDANYKSICDAFTLMRHKAYPAKAV